MERLTEWNEDLGLYVLANGATDRDVINMLGCLEDDRENIFAGKIWSREDLRNRLEENGFDPTEENVDKVIKHGGKWSSLNDSTDGDWDYIDEQILLAL